METIYMDDFLDGGVLREASFRKSVEEIDWSQYSRKRVLIKGCSEVPVPTWAYLILTARLVPHADRILYGEPCAPVRVFERDHGLHESKTGEKLAGGRGSGQE